MKEFFFSEIRYSNKYTYHIFDNKCRVSKTGRVSNISWVPNTSWVTNMSQSGEYNLTFQLQG